MSAENLIDEASLTDRERLVRLAAQQEFQATRIDDLMASQGAVPKSSWWIRIGLVACLLASGYASFRAETNSRAIANIKDAGDCGRGFLLMDSEEEASLSEEQVLNVCPMLADAYEIKDDILNPP